MVKKIVCRRPHLKIWAGSAIISSCWNYFSKKYVEKVAADSLIDQVHLIYPSRMVA